MRLAQLPPARWSTEADARSCEDWRRLATVETGERMRVVLAERSALSGGCRQPEITERWSAER